MIRHIVMFKLKEFPDAYQKAAAAKELKMKLDELPLQINVIRRYEAGIDIRNLPWSYDIVLIMDFDSMTDLETYTVHPAHQKFIDFNKAYSVAKVCTDYEV